MCVPYTENQRRERERVIRDRELQYENRRLREELSRTKQHGSSTASSSRCGPGIFPAPTVHSSSASSSSVPAAPLTSGTVPTSGGSQDVPQCVVCMDGPVEVMFNPCGHIKVCRICAQATRECPVCRQPIQGITRVYL
jgi:hypothetical protein